MGRSAMTKMSSGLLVMLLLGARDAVGQVSAADQQGQSAYQFDAAYISEVWRNTSGGLRTGEAYLGNLDLMLSVDGERAWGVPGLSAFVYVLYNHGESPSDRLVGDAMTLSNIDAPEALRLYEAWLEWQNDATRPLSVRFGLYDLNSEFDTNDTRGLFIHSNHGVGHDLAQSGRNGPSIFPVAALGLRAAWAPSEHWLLLAALFDGAPGDPDDPTRTRIHLSDDEGALAIAELQYSAERVSKMSLGYWRYTSELDDVRTDAPGEWRAQRGNSGGYASLELALGPLDGESLSPASAFVRYGVADGRFNEFDRVLAAGVRYRGVFRADDADEIGLAYSSASTGGEVRWAHALLGEPRERYERAIELTYKVPLTEWLTVQPDVQYIVNPGADAQLEDSLVFGLRLEFAWGITR